MKEKIHQEYERLVANHTHSYAVKWLALKYQQSEDEVLQTVDSL